MTTGTISKIQHARLFIHKKQTKLRNVYIYKKPDTLQKERNLRYVLRLKTDTLRYAIFHEMFKLAFIYKKYGTLRYLTFLYTKSGTLRKKQDNLRYVFIYKNPDTLRYAISIEFLKLAEGRRAFFICKKQCTLIHIFICKKQCTLGYVFI